jgi:uncharacterized protein YyaL (SSP411 family)
MKSISPIDGKATAYVCENFVCQLPTTNAKTLAGLLIDHPNDKSSKKRR